MKRPGAAPRDDIARGGLDDLDHWVAIFVRGVTTGALVGAAIAGSAIWRRRAGATERSTTGAGSGEDPRR